MVLEYLSVFLSWPVMVTVVLFYVLIYYRKELKIILKAIADYEYWKIGKFEIQRRKTEEKVRKIQSLATSEADPTAKKLLVATAIHASICASSPPIRKYYKNIADETLNELKEEESTSPFIQEATPLIEALETWPYDFASPSPSLSDVEDWRSYESDDENWPFDVPSASPSPSPSPSDEE